MKKVAFFRPGTSIPANVRVAEVLKDSFPEYEIEILDIACILKRHRFHQFICVLSALKHYGVAIVLGDKRLRACMTRTPYFFNFVKRYASHVISPETYVFSFQIQSLFDAKCPGVRHFVYTDHTCLANLEYPDFEISKLPSDEWIALERTIYQNADRVFTRSSNITQSVIEQYGCSETKVSCVYAGSNATQTVPYSEEKDYTGAHILFVGLDWERKGGPTLIAAFSKVLEVHPHARLTIVGAAPDVQKPGVKVIGRVPLEKIGRYYESATVFCMPTKIEPFGIVFAEALNYKLPIVSTSIGAVPDMVIDGVNGYLLKPGDEEGIADRLIELLSDPEKCRLFGQRGLKLAVERYDWAQVGQRLRKYILD